LHIKQLEVRWKVSEALGYLGQFNLSNNISRTIWRLVKNLEVPEEAFGGVGRSNSNFVFYRIKPGSIQLAQYFYYMPLFFL